MQQVIFLTNTEAYIITGALEFFGMEDVNGKPTIHLLPDTQDDKDGQRNMWGLAYKNFSVNMFS